MKSFAIFFVLLIASLAAAQTSKTDVEYINDVLYPATTLLYSQDSEGGMRMRCTATAIEKNKTGYVFVTAAHCACEDDTDRHTVSPEKAFFFITPDEQDSKTFLKAQAVGCGYRHKGDDFALFQVDTKAVFPIVALGKDPSVIESVVNIASPLGLGKQVFLGSVSAPALDRPVVEGDINWTGVVLLQMFGVNGGSSGSAVVCLDQHAICGFVVGSIGQTTMTAMPVSRLILVRDGIAKGTYKAWQPDMDKPPSSDGKK